MARGRLTEPFTALPALQNSCSAAPILMHPESLIGVLGVMRPWLSAGRGGLALKGWRAGGGGAEGGDGFNRGAGRIQAADRAVEAGGAGVGAEQLLEALLRDRAREHVGVIRRVRAHREDLAVARVERDERARRAGAARDRAVEDRLARALE